MENKYAFYQFPLENNSETDLWYQTCYQWTWATPLLLMKGIPGPLYLNWLAAVQKNFLQSQIPQLNGGIRLTVRNWPPNPVLLLLGGHRLLKKTHWNTLITFLGALVGVSNFLTNLIPGPSLTILDMSELGPSNTFSGRKMIPQWIRHFLNPHSGMSHPFLIVPIL